MNNFMKFMLRNISRNKGFTFINVTGLAIGMAASLLILLWIREELSYDKFNRNAENIYRVEEDQYYSNGRYHVTVTPQPSGPEWKEKIPGIVEQTRINRLPRILFRKDEQAFFESSVVAADSGFFKMFTLPFIRGESGTALNNPHSIVLSRTLAEKYFGDTDPLGKTLILENKYEFMITGVMEDIPRNSIFNYVAVLPYSFLREIGAMSDSWGSNSILTFVFLQKGTDINEVNTKLTDVVKEHNPETTTRYMLFPFLDIHLHAQFGYKENNGPVTAILIFSLIAVFILIIACINFINLSTAKAASRANEIAIKKITGAGQRTLVTQFMLESTVIVLIAMIMAFILIGLLLNVFSTLSGKSFLLSDLFQVRFLITFIATGIVTAFLSGLYPAFYLSSIKPVAAMKAEKTTGKNKIKLRQILVITQFSMSILISVAAVFMYLQLKFLREKDLGFDKNDLVCIQMGQNMKDKYYSLKEELLKEPLIKGVTASTHNPVMIGSNSSGVSWDGKDPDQEVLVGTCAIDYDYLETMKMKLASGRDFSKQFTSDLAKDTTGNFLINEEVARIMNTGDPVNTNFRFMGIKGKIVGVLKDFNFKGADQPIEPLAFALVNTNYLNYILIRLTHGNIQASLKSLEKVWKEIIPEYPLQYTFIDQDYDNLFKSQARLTGLLKYFTILSLVIACLGLYGLSSYSAVRRTNEIGIRKVLGADAVSVVYSMVLEFIILITISLVIALPLGYLVVEKLLGQFAVRININPAIFIAITAGTLAVALVTVSFQAIKATRVNPVEALKVE